MSAAIHEPAIIGSPPPNHRLLGGGAALVTAVLLLIAGCGQDQNRGPVLLVEPNSYEISPRHQGEPIARFRLTNTGDSPLEIRDVLSACGCTTVRLPKKLIPPDGTTTLAVRVARPPIGSRSTAVTIRTNSRSTPSIELQITCWARNNSPRVIRTLPGRISLYRTTSDLSRPALLVVTTLEFAAGAPDCRLTSDLPFVRVQPDGIDDAPLPSPDYMRRSYRYLISLDEAAPFGRFSGILTFHSRLGSESREEHTRVPIEIRVDPPVWAVPYSLFAVVQNDSELPTWKVNILSSDSKRIPAVRSIECDSDPLQVEFIPLNHPSPTQTADSLLARLVVGVKQAALQLPIEATITVHLGDKEFSQIQIPVTLVGAESKTPDSFQRPETP